MLSRISIPILSCHICSEDIVISTITRHYDFSNTDTYIFECIGTHDVPNVHTKIPSSDIQRLFY
jgi:hypothetical protein